MNKLKEISKKYKISLAAIIIAIVLLTISASYALYKIVRSQDDENLVNAGCFNLALSNEENAINLESTIPLTDAEGRKLTPFTFTLTNNCTITASYNVNLEVLSGSTLSSSFVATLFNNGDIKTLNSYPSANTTIKGSIESRTLQRGVLAPGSSVDYSVSLWLDEDVTLEDNVENTKLKSKIVIISTPYFTKGYSGIEGNIVAQLDTSGKCPTVNTDGSIKITDVETGNGYLCSAPDNYGTSYYYRGNVTNNYVQFGKWADDTPDVVYGFYSSNEDGSIPSFNTFSSLEECRNDSSYNNCTVVSLKGKPMYWRIVRINGDGTVRLVYAGTDTYSNSQYALDKQVYGNLEEVFGDTVDLKVLMSIYDTAGAGYMYGNPDGVVETTKAIPASVYSSSKYYLAKEYTFTAENGFKLTNQVEITGDNITSDYIGYYLAQSDFNSEDVGFLFKIESIDKDNEKINGKFISYGSNSKETAQNNQVGSINKIIIDDFYQKNIKDKKYEQYLADNLFCSDRTISDASYDGEYVTNEGFGSNYTIYRWGGYASAPNYLVGMPTAASVNSALYCNNNDSFTTSNDKGNGALTYPVGLLTADEAVLAGAYYGKANNKYYLYVGGSLALMSPFSGSAITNIMDVPINFNTSIAKDGALSTGTVLLNDDSAAVAINLKQGVLKSGTGTKEDPYRIAEDKDELKVNIASYINGKLSDTFPPAYSKDEYEVEKVECNNNISASWNVDKWSLETSNLSSSGTCNVYFKKQTSADTITIANQTIKVNEKNKCPQFNNAGNVKLTAAEDTDGYVCATKDNYGYSYYFRGTVDNNYVKFADKYWRIVRINGDGTVRIIYDGTSVHTNGESSTDRFIGNSPYNSYWKKDNVVETPNIPVTYDNAGLGYMYGNRSGINESIYKQVGKFDDNTTYYLAKEYSYDASTGKFNLVDPVAVLGSNIDATYINYYTFHATSATETRYIIDKIVDFEKYYDYNHHYTQINFGTASKENAQTNTNDSDIKTYLDNWHKTNMLNYTNYLADNIFCNYRKLSYSGYDGYGAGYTYYASLRSPIYAEDGTYYKTINLKCSQQNDAFTVSDTSNGNGSLTYPIGLLTGHELYLSGYDSSSNNKGYYLYDSNNWWTMTPDSFENRAYMMSSKNYYESVDYSYGVRPVYNLKAGVLNAGTGTASDPFRIE